MQKRKLRIKQFKSARKESDSWQCLFEVRGQFKRAIKHSLIVARGYAGRVKRKMLFLASRYRDELGMHRFEGFWALIPSRYRSMGLLLLFYPNAGYYACLCMCACFCSSLYYWPMEVYDMGKPIDHSSDSVLARISAGSHVCEKRETFLVLNLRPALSLHHHQRTYTLCPTKKRLRYMSKLRIISIGGLHSTQIYL